MRRSKMNKNVVITTNAPAIGDLLKTTSLISTEQTLDSKESSYKSLQLKLSIYVICFYIVLYILLVYKYELARFQRFLHRLFMTYLINMPVYVKLRLFLAKLNVIYFNFNITNVQSVFRSFSHNISTINNFFLSTAPNANRLGRFVFNNFKTFILLFTNIRKSIETVTVTFAFSMRKLLLVPMRLRNAIRICVYEISNFWRSIEQIIQFIKLPIAVLSVMFKFIKSLSDFLHRLERPKKPRLL